MAEQTNLSKTKRIKELDVVRALCALWVVGYWHLACYLPDSSGVYTPLGQCVTEIFMAGFFFISGFLHHKYTFSNRDDVSKFFRRKFFRFYILFALSAGSLYIANQYIGVPMFKGPWHLLLTLLGITTLYPPHAGMLWFMSMIMLFYVLTPFIMYNSKWRYAKLAKFTSVILFLVAWLLIMGKLDVMVFVYLTVYFLGLICPEKIFKTLQSSIPAMLISAAIACIAITVGLNTEHTWWENFFFSIPSCVCGTLVIIGVSTVISKSDILLAILSYVAYSSLCAYLFHRHYYSVINTSLEHLGIESNAAVLICVYLPICITASWFIQKLYDRMIVFAEKKNQQVYERNAAQ